MRKISGIIHAQLSEVAPGVQVRRPLPAPGLRHADPFLLLDHFGPEVPRQPNRIPRHPHKGFQPITLVFEGAIRHTDSLGNDTTVHDGGTQWVNAAGGIWHAEEIGPSRETGRIHGVQLWVNLPAANKQDPPEYSAYQRANVPEQSTADYTLRLLAGQLNGLDGPAPVKTPVVIAHLLARPHAQIALSLPDGYTAQLYVLEGRVQSAGESLEAYDLALYADEAAQVEIRAETDCQLLFLAGRPIQEPIASYGPFVMNTFQEIEEALRQFS